MYIESNGELGFPHHRMGPGGEGGWRHHMQSGGPGAEMQVQPGYAQPTQMTQIAPNYGHPHHRHHGWRGADGVEIMGPPPAGAPVVVPPVVAMPVSQHSDTAMYVAGGVMVLGLAYVLWKVVKS